MDSALSKEDQQWISENMESSTEARGEYSDGAYTFSFINGQPGLVIRGNHSKEISQRLDAILPVFKRFKEAVDGGRVEKAEQTQHNASEGHFCSECGAAMEFKSGTSKQGKPWKGWFCSKSRDHKPLWI